MATGIDWNHPDLYEQLSRDHPAQMRRPSPTPEEREEERRKGMELFEEIFADRMYPPEVHEEVPEPTPPRKPVFLPDPSPVEIYSPPRMWGKKEDPPKWLTHSMDRDMFENRIRPDWYSRFTDKSYPKSPMPPPYPLEAGVSPPFWDISEILQLGPEDDRSLFMTPPTPSSPPPPPELEPPLPDFQHDPNSPATSFDMAMHQMHWELQKYEDDKEHIVHFVQLAPLVRDFEILSKELKTMVKFHIPDFDAEGLSPLLLAQALKYHVKITEGRMVKRYNIFEKDFYNVHYPDISEEVVAAEVRLHKQKALDAIETYKRNYIYVQEELDKAEVEKVRVRDLLLKNNALSRKIHAEIEKAKAEEVEEEQQYERHKIFVHGDNCPYREQAEAAYARQMELRRLIPEMKKELERTKVAYERDVKNMEVWVTLFPPNFVDRIRKLLLGCLQEDGYKPVPVERYMQFLEDLDEDLQNMKNSRQSDFDSLDHRCRESVKILNESMAELGEARRVTNELLQEQSILGAELQSVRLEVTKRRDLWAKLREEYVYYKDYNELLLGKIIALRAHESLQSDDLPVTASPESGSPSPVASPPSEAFNISQIESSPRFGESPDFLTGQRPPSEMQNISDLSQNGESPGYESIPQGQAQSDNLDDERPPSEMLDLSDTLGDEGPPSEMLDFSGLQGGGSFLDSPEDSASPGKKTILIPSPGKMEPLRMDVEIIPQDIRRSPSGQRVVCDVAVQMQEVALRPPRRIEKRYKVVRGTPPISQTVGRRVDRRHGMFTPRSAIRRQHIGVRRPLFAGDFESPDSPWGTGRRTHPELMNLPQRSPSPRPPRLDTTIEWEDPKMNTGFRE